MPARLKLDAFAVPLDADGTKWITGPRVLLLAAAMAALLTGPGLPLREVAFGVVLAPWAEEAVFRRGLHEELLRRRLRPAWRVLLVASGFAGVHAWHHGWAGAVGVLAPALLIGIDYERHRAWWRCVGLHAAMNVLWLSSAPWAARFA